MLLAKMISNRTYDRESSFKIKRSSAWSALFTRLLVLVPFHKQVLNKKARIMHHEGTIQPK
eukprot:CCRYP_002644-RA/>CCRYP_002644-RA protein AED:0.00 eAED:0.00 QI:165/1/0.5/1/0/0/2/0/60